MHNSFEEHPEGEKREVQRDLLRQLMDARTRQSIASRELSEAQATYDTVSREVNQREQEVERQIGDWADRFAFARDEFYLARSRTQANLREGIE